MVASVDALELRARFLRSVPAHLRCRRAEFVQVQCPVDGCHVEVPWVSRRGWGWCRGGTSGGAVRLVSGPVSSQETGPSAASCRSRRSSRAAQSIVWRRVGWRWEPHPGWRRIRGEPTVLQLGCQCCRCRGEVLVPLISSPCSAGVPPSRHRQTRSVTAEKHVRRTKTWLQ